MTASISPDDYSDSSKDASSREQPGFVYDDPNASPTEPEPNYVPEREFVLMPLFRRIGEMLGIRRHVEPQYTYEAAFEAPQSQINSSYYQDADLAADRQSARTEPAIVQNAPPRHDPEQEWAKPQPEVPSEVLSQPAPDISEPITLEETAAQLSPETPVSLPTVEEYEILSEEPGLTPERVQASEAELIEASPKPLEEVAAAPQEHFENTQSTPVVQVQAPETPSPVAKVAVARSESQVQPQRVRPATQRKDEIDEAIAILREAGSKISAAISQAVEWLSEKEEELVRRAERSLAPPKVRRVQPSAARNAPGKQPLPVSRASAEAKPAASKPVAIPDPGVPQWEPLQFPALQREVSWTGNLVPSRPADVSSSKAQSVDGVSSTARRGPALVSPRRRAPFWKRIDWAAEFTPKRVAVLGGVVMALLIVAGVTFARRPASEVLPPQPRTIQPGGVTVTTHPKSSLVTAPASAQQSQKTPPAKRAVVLAPRRPQPTVTSEEPEVVTHVYKQKPSPAKQSTATVAGVKHYSDMN